MHTYRFFLPAESLKQSTVKLTGADAHHALNVLKLKAGDSIIIFDGIETEYIARISSSKHNELILSDLKESRRHKIQKPVIELYAALVPKFDDIVQAATELGVSAIFPVFTERTKVRLSIKHYGKKVERWKRIAISASMQCGRIVLPEIYEPLSLHQALEEIKKNRLGLVASLELESRPILEVLNEIGCEFSYVAIFIGPPADFTKNEISVAKSYGLIPVRIVPNTLRSETAALSALAVISSFFYTRSL